MNNYDRLQEMLHDASGQKQFLEWCRSDITQLMIGATRDRFARPRPPDASGIMDVSRSVFELGRVCGVSEVADFWANPKDDMQEALGRLASIKPEYGAERPKGE